MAEKEDDRKVSEKKMVHNRFTGLQSRVAAGSHMRSPKMQHKAQHALANPPGTTTTMG